MCLNMGKKRVESGRNGVSHGQDRSTDKSSREKEESDGLEIAV